MQRFENVIRHSYPQHYIGVSCQLPALAALPLRNDTQNKLAPKPAWAFGSCR